MGARRQHDGDQRQDEKGRWFTSSPGSPDSHEKVPLGVGARDLFTPDLPIVMSKIKRPNFSDMLIEPQITEHAGRIPISI